MGTDASKKIIIYAGNTDEDPCIQVGGGGTKLSSEGLYLPSTSSGVIIDTVTGPGTTGSNVIITLKDPDAVVLEEPGGNWSAVKLPGLELKPSDKILNPWSEIGPDIELRDQITKVVAIMLLPNGEEQLIECTVTDSDSYYYIYRDYDDKGNVSGGVFIAFNDTYTSVQ